MGAKRAILVFGAGAVGCYLGAHLAAAGQDVTVLVRPRVAEEMQRHGVLVDGHGENLTAHPAIATAVANLPAYDLVLLAVRADDVAAAIPDLTALLGHDGLLIAVQNGVGTEELLGAALGCDRVLAAALTTSVVMKKPGMVVRTGGASGMAMATLGGSAPPGWVLGTFTDAGVSAVGVDDYRALRWSKLLLNMLGAPISAILDCDMQSISEHPGLFRLEQLALREAGRVMDAQHIRTVDLPGYQIRAARILMRLPRFLAQRLIGPRMMKSRGGRAPGMRVDMHRNRSEVAWFNGAIADAGHRLGVPTPVNTALTALTLDLVADPDRREEFRGRPEALIAWARTHGVRI